MLSLNSVTLTDDIRLTLVIHPSDFKMQNSEFRRKNSEFHRKTRLSRMIEGMVNPFEIIMFFFESPFSEEAYSLLFFAKLLHHSVTMLSRINLD